MQLGWIDFSKEEREKVLDVIQLLQEPGAVDELGIGSIRDAFANYFFPGTSTVQTRAKYFLIVPYILKEAGEGKYGSDKKKILKQVDEEEKKCGLKLIQGDKRGVIGSLVLPRSWVARKPSNIYWNGIKEFGIFRNKYLSIHEYIEKSILLNNMKKGTKLGNRYDTAEENEKDDKDAGDILSFQFWNLPSVCNTNWKENLTIDLLPEEAQFLKKQIQKEQQGTLFAYILRHHIDVSKYESFAALTEVIHEDIPQNMREMIDLANAFNRFVYMVRIRYNVLLSGGENEVANDEWDYYEPVIDEMVDVDLNQVYERLLITNFRLKKFLNELQKAFMTRDYANADKLIRDRECNLKGPSRAKLNRIGEYPSDEWVGGGWLDFRFSAAKRIINDIYAGEEVTNV